MPEYTDIFISLSDTATMPTKATPGSAGFDLYADNHTKNSYVHIPPGKTRTVGTGLSLAIPDGYFGAVFARSGLATRNGIRPANCVGVIDSDYRGEIKVPLHNDGESEVLITHGTRIAQLIFIPYVEHAMFRLTDKLDETVRGDGGFGSTGR